MAKKIDSLQKHPLAEVFGYKPTDKSSLAKKSRNGTLCPYNNLVDVCTKVSKANPLGVCSLHYDDLVTVICPVRFREDWRICSDAVSFFFPKATHWTPLKEIRLKEKTGDSAGNVDLIIAAHDEKGKIYDFGAVEVQAVYVSGNIKNPFEHYMKDPDARGTFDWTKEANYPRPDFLSSSRKRLIPQVMYKGQIFRAWGKKMAIVVDLPFFETLPDLPKRAEKDSDICWLIYQLTDNPSAGRFHLDLDKKIYTGFDETMKKLGTPEIGSEAEFVSELEKKLATELTEISKEGFASFSERLGNHQTLISRNEGIRVDSSDIEKFN